MSCSIVAVRDRASVTLSRTYLVPVAPNVKCRVGQDAERQSLCPGGANDPLRGYWVPPTPSGPSSS
jgi:hypothetical protein